MKLLRFDFIKVGKEGKKNIGFNLNLEFTACVALPVSGSPHLHASLLVVCI